MITCCHLGTVLSTTLGPSLFLFWSLFLSFVLVRGIQVPVRVSLFADIVDDLCAVVEGNAYFAAEFVGDPLVVDMSVRRCMWPRCSASLCSPISVPPYCATRPYRCPSSVCSPIPVVSPFCATSPPISPCSKSSSRRARARRSALRWSHVRNDLGSGSNMDSVIDDDFWDRRFGKFGHGDPPEVVVLESLPFLLSETRVPSVLVLAELLFQNVCASDPVVPPDVVRLQSCDFVDSGFQHDVLVEGQHGCLPSVLDELQHVILPRADVDPLVFESGVLDTRVAPVPRNGSESAVGAGVLDVG